MKVALTGAGGMLGHAVQQVFSDLSVIPLTHDLLDVTVLDDVVRTIRTIQPALLIHAAAFTNVDQCESEPDLACRTNGLGARNIAIACEEVGCPVMYVSTDYVFDGTKGSPYDEWDRTNPLNTYGMSKLMGERFVSSLTNRFYIIRTSWLYGPRGRNFVDTINALLTERDRITVVNDQTGCPTFTLDLARSLRQLTRKGYGIYHVTNSESCTWYDFARAIAEKRGLEHKISPVTTAEFPRPARRPAYSVLGRTMLRLEGLGETRPWREALDEYLSSLP